VKLACGDDQRQVDLRQTRAGLQATVDGVTLALEVRALAPGAFLLRREGSAELFHCVRAGDQIHLFWRGVAYRLAEQREGRRAQQRHGAGGLEAPMPGKVIAVKVAPGQQVAKGQELVLVEAMKMENAIRAPRDGRVKSVAARPGEMVAPGSVLVELE
jgi:acetyl/propionyl-CoA carboxylase alpha subunit